MYGQNKRILLLFVLILTGSFFQPVKAETSGICASDERVLLAVPGEEVMMLYAYDENGNRMGRLPQLTWGENAKLVKENALFLSEEDEQSVLRAGDMKRIARYPEEKYIVRALGDCYVTLEKGGSRAVLYDSAARILGTVSFSGSFDPEGYYSFELFELTDTWLLKVTDYNITQWALICKDGWVNSEITDPGMLEKLNNDDGNVYALGDFLVWCPNPYLEDRSGGVVMTQEGLVVMDNVTECLSEETAGYPYDVYVPVSYERHSPAVFVVRDTGNGYDLYDASLEYAGHTDHLPEYPECAGGFVQGFAYEELGGGVCEGFLTDCSDFTPIPYGWTQDGIVVYRSGKTEAVPDNAEPFCISDGYYVCTDGDVTHVYRRSDDVLLAEYERAPEGCISLGRDGIRMDDDLRGEYWWDTPSTIYDNAGNVTYRSKDRFVFAFVNGTWSTRRGIYRGIIDGSGNWLLKDTMETE